MASKFSFDNAAFHFARTDGPRGFLWKFLLAYILLGAVLNILNFGLQFVLFGGINGLQDSLISGNASFAMIGIYYLFAMVAGVSFWAVFESQVQRRYVRDEGFSLQLGADELRIVGVALLWILFFIAGYVVSILAVMGLMMPVSQLMGSSAGFAGLWMFAVFAAISCVWIWVTVKLSAASALTIRDRKVKFIDSWAATEGRFWPLFGAYLALSLFFFIAYLILAAVFFGLVLGGGLNFSDPTAIAALMTPQGIGLSFIVITFVMMIFQGIGLYVWSGPAALAAKTDPRGGGAINIADEFS